MTRDEFIEKCDLIRYETKYSAQPWDMWLTEMLANDAEQRRVIEQLNGIIARWEDTYAGQKEIREQQAQQIATLREAL